jgi:hypothetical protein
MYSRFGLAGVCFELLSLLFVLDISILLTQRESITYVEEIYLLRMQ